MCLKKFYFNFNLQYTYYFNMYIVEECDSFQFFIFNELVF